MHINKTKYIFMLISFFHANPIFACEVSNIQELPVELIIAIADKTIHYPHWSEYGKTPKEIFGDFINFLSASKQLNAIKQLLFSDKDIIKLRDRAIWESTSVRMDNYKRFVGSLKAADENPDLINDGNFLRKNALHLAVTRNDHVFLKNILSKLMLVKDEKAYKHSIISIIEQRCSDDGPSNIITTPLCLAVDQANFACAKLLLDAGANPNKQAQYRSLIDMTEELIYRCFCDRDIVINEDSWFSRYYSPNRSRYLDQYLKIFQLLLPVTNSTCLSEVIGIIERRGCGGYNPMEPMPQWQRDLQIKNDIRDKEYVTFLMSYIPAVFNDSKTG